MLVVLNGPAGVGKTTVSRSLAAKVDGTVCISGADSEIVECIRSNTSCQ